MYLPMYLCTCAFLNPSRSLRRSLAALVLATHTLSFTLECGIVDEIVESLHLPAQDDMPLETEHVHVSESDQDATYRKLHQGACSVRCAGCCCNLCIACAYQNTHSSLFLTALHPCVGADPNRRTLVDGFVIVSPIWRYVHVANLTWYYTFFPCAVCWDQ